MTLLTVRSAGKPARWYIDGKRVSQTAYDVARTGKTLDCFVTKIYRRASDGHETVRHYVEAR